MVTVSIVMPMNAAYNTNTFAGLLTYLLSKEGVNGCGIDARKRRIWERFAVSADLHQTSLDPSSAACAFLPPSVDFLIGNHSDELTPWIPVMAARYELVFLK